MVFAFVSLVSSDAYLPGALAQVTALRELHPDPAPPPELPFHTVCLVTPESVDVATIRRLRSAYDHVVGVEILEQDNASGLKLLGRPDLTTVLTKLHVFRLTQYQKIIFLDADVLPVQPMSHLFSLPHEFSAAPDVGWPDIFNSGVMVLTPGEDKFEQLNQLVLSKPSWDGGDQGILNEWRGGDWNRLSFTYNTTPTAAYTYAPAYERYGSQIKAIHFIGPNKPWNSIPYRTPNSRRHVDSSDAVQRAYDYDSLVDRWFDVYERHYDTQPTAPTTPFEVSRYVSAWDEPTHPEQPPPPPVGTLNLDELKRLAIEGLSASTADVRPGEGTYQSLPLQGRVDLMRPRKKDPEVIAKTDTEAENPRQDLHFQILLPDQLDRFQTDYFDYDETLSTPLARQAALGVTETRWHTLPTPGPNEVPSSPRLRRISLPTTPSALPLFPTPTPDFYASESERESLLLSRADREQHHHHQQSSVRGHHSSHQPQEPVTQQQEGQQHHQPHGELPQLHEHQQPHRYQQPHHHQQQPQYQQPQLPQPHHHQQPHQYQQPHEQQHNQEQGNVQHQQEEPTRPRSPPMMKWNPAIEPPPDTAPPPNAFPTDTYFSNVWDLTPSRQNDQSHDGPSPPDSSGFFQPPPASIIPEPLLKQGHYRNVTGESSLGATPSPDRRKIKPVFPWEEAPRVMPSRVFPDSDAPPPSLFLSPESQSQTSATAPSTPETRPAPRTQILSPLYGLPAAFTYSNAWDNIPSIQHYASKLVKPLQPAVPPPVLAPAFEDDVYRKGRKKTWDERTEMSSRDGDDEDNADDEDEDGPTVPSAIKWDDDSDGESAKRRSRRGSVITASSLVKGSSNKKEYKHRGVQTTVIETRSMAVQVDPPRPERHLKRGSVSARKHWAPTTGAGVVAPMTTTRDFNLGVPLSVNTLAPPVSQRQQEYIRPKSKPASPSISPPPRSPIRSPREFIVAAPRTVHKSVSPPLRPDLRPSGSSSSTIVPNAGYTALTAQEHRSASAVARTPTATSPGDALTSVLHNENFSNVERPLPLSTAPVTKRRKSADVRSSPASIARKPSNESSLGSPASSLGPLSPVDVHTPLSPIRKGTRVWDPARGVDLFKRGSEEVLARFLKMGSWEEEAR